MEAPFLPWFYFDFIDLFLLYQNGCLGCMYICAPRVYLVASDPLGRE